LNEINQSKCPLGPRLKSSIEPTGRDRI